jgi:hypothetical protein
MRKLMAALALMLGTGGLVAAQSTPAHADDDRKVRAGSCSGKSQYRMVLREAGDDPDRLRVVFKVNGTKPNRTWRFKVKRYNKVVHRATKRANRYGDVKIRKRFRGDDDARVKVIARAGYGERCTRVMRLDD